jgi:hypothetical protein
MENKARNLLYKCFHLFDELDIKLLKLFDDEAEMLVNEKKLHLKNKIDIENFVKYYFKELYRLKENL